MSALQSVSLITRESWNAALSQLPYAHILQTWEWGEFKHATTGWQPHRLAWSQAGRIVAMASIGVRGVGPFKVIYAPKGPALAYEDANLAAFVLNQLQTFAHQHGAIWLKIDPDVIAASGIPADPDDSANPTGQALIATLKQRGWRFSADQVQFRNTVTLDLTRSEDELLAAMGQSTRRKIRTAEREGVTIREGTTADLALLYDLYQTTGQRDNFLIRPLSYYQEAWRRFIEAGLALPLIAEANRQAIAAIILFHFGRTCWYFYGMSANDAREKQPNYLLQWSAIRWAKANGYACYDFWGAPDEFVESDKLWGVYQFKRGFHGTVTRHIGAWDFVPNPALYAAYTRALPRILNLLKRRS